MAREAFEAAFKDALTLPGLELHLQKTWGAAYPNYRHDLQAALQARTEAEAEPHTFSTSISHSPSLGGFALLPKTQGSIGFDIEIQSRVSKKVVERIKANGETWDSTTTPPALIWTAKESLFKSLRGPAQPRVLTDLGLEIVSDSSHLMLFKAFTAATRTSVQQPLQGLGAALQCDQHCLAIFCHFALPWGST